MTHPQIDDKFARRHPLRAAEEAALRRHNAKLKDRFGHKREGTLETLDKASRVRQGALARMFMAGHITTDQLAWAAEIRSIAERIGRDVAIGTVSLETRVDCGANRSARLEEGIGRVRCEVAYTSWRKSLDKPPVVLAMIVQDVAVRRAAKHFRMRDSNVRKMLTEAIDAWPDHCRDARDSVDAMDLAIVRARLA